MAERKNIDFDRPGGYAMPKGATQVHRQAAKAMIDADVRLYGDSAKLYQPQRMNPPRRVRPKYQADDP
ncbi:MAG: hypothetical protein O6758_03055, partial [Planctomycetota bacterium]|nr:hypothetical protein [Planctomycetota bacterium]